MSRATRPHRALLLFVGVLVVIAGLIWGGGHRSRVEAKAPAPAPAVAVAASALPAPVVTPEAQRAVARPGTVAGAAGMRIFKDPNSDMPGAPTQEASTLEMDSNSEDMTGLRQEVLPDGSVMVDLQGRFQESMVIQMTPDGRRVTNCTRDVKKALANPPVSQAPQREER